MMHVHPYMHPISSSSSSPPLPITPSNKHADGHTNTHSHTLVLQLADEQRDRCDVSHPRHLTVDRRSLSICSLHISDSLWHIQYISPSPSFQRSIYICNSVSLDVQESIFLLLHVFYPFLPSSSQRPLLIPSLCLPFITTDHLSLLILRLPPCSFTLLYLNQCC